MDIQEFEKRKKDLLIKMYKEKNYRFYPTYQERHFLKELYMQDGNLFYRVEEDDSNNITMAIFNIERVEKELLEIGIIKLCPFRKRQVADEIYRESSHYKEEFLPCYQGKCMFYIYNETLTNGFCGMKNQ